MGWGGEGEVRQGMGERRRLREEGCVVGKGREGENSGQKHATEICLHSTQTKQEGLKSQ